MLSSMSKLQAVEMLTRVTDKALQIHGGIGFWQPNAIERVYRDARAQRFEEGTNEIQKTVIARELLGKREAAHEPAFREQGLADHRKLARNRPSAGAHARARRRGGRGQLRSQCRARDSRRCARSKRSARAQIAVQANMENVEEIDALFDRVEQSSDDSIISFRMPRRVLSRRSSISRRITSTAPSI